MSYCRWSTDDFQCDVYVYSDVSGGITTVVAGNRLIYKSELPAPIPWPEKDDLDNEEVMQAWGEKYKERYDLMAQLREEADRVYIDLPYAGESFNDATPGAAADRLQELKDLGYVVPQEVIDTLRREQDDES